MTHASHGGEAAHEDLGDGRVMWRDWWSLEGSATDIVIADCGSGQTLRLRSAEENMNARQPMDRTDEVLKVVARHEMGARVFATLERIAGDLETVARDIVIASIEAENCACAAAYPALKGDKEEYKPNGL